MSIEIGDEGAVARRDPPIRRRRCLVVGVDQSPGTEQAVLLAVEVAADLDAAVILVHATLRGHGNRPSEADLARWGNVFAAAGVTNVRTIVEDDDAIRLLFRIAEEQDAYMIVVGPTGQGEFREFVMGGVAVELAHHGRRPVLIAATDHSEIKAR